MAQMIIHSVLTIIGQLLVHIPHVVPDFFVVRTLQ
jgi:hypothetical protein